MVPQCPPGMVAMYRNGASVRQVGDKYGHSFHQARRMLIQTGVTIRPGGRSVPECPPDMIAMYENGASIRKVGKRYGHKYTRARHMLLQAGVTLRPPKLNA